MAITFRKYWDWHTGSANGAVAEAPVLGNGQIGNNATDGHPAPQYSTEEYTITWDNDGSAAGEFCYPDGAISLSGLWLSYAQKMTWTNFGTTGDSGRFFFTAGSSAVPAGGVLWSLWWDTDGDLWIEDANGTEIARDSTVLSTNTEYYFEVLWKQGNSSTMKVWYWAKGGTRNTLIDSTTFDSDDGSTTTGAPAFVVGNGAVGKTYRAYAGSGWWATHNSTNWDDENITNHGDLADDATLREWDCIRYINELTTGVPDSLETTLSNSKQWGYADGHSDGDTCQYGYTTGQTGNKEGYNDTSHDGPLDDADVTGDINAARWMWEYKSSGTAAAHPSFNGRYGHNGNINLTGAQAKSTSYAFYSTLIGLGDANFGDVPTTSEDIAIGFRARRTGTIGSGTLTVRDMWATILHIQPAPTTTTLFMLNGIGTQAAG